MLKILKSFFLGSLVVNAVIGVETTPPPLELTVSTHYGAGFFAEIDKVVDNILHFSKHNLKYVFVDWTDPFFLYKEFPSENGWDLYFEPILISEEFYDRQNAIKEKSGNHFHEIHDYLCIDHWVNYENYLPYRLSINKVLNKYIKIKEPILSKVETIVNQEMDGFYCIGVHVRYGCDHGSEAPKGNVNVSDYIKEVEELLLEQDENQVKIYLATDSKLVVKVFKTHFPDKVITLDTFRSEEREVPHLVYGNGDYWLAHEEEFHQKKPGYRGGEGVLMDCLLLAKCNVFVHSSSNIASFVTYFNPYIRSIYLPKNDITWPCRHGK